MKNMILNYIRLKKASARAKSYYGFHRVAGGWVYRELAPNASQVFLAGEFNDWDWTSHPLLNLENGTWVLFLPGEDALWDGCKVKTCVDGRYKLPNRTRRVLRKAGWYGEVCSGMDAAFPEEAAPQLCQSM